jgi:hypothetical protein
MCSRTIIDASRGNSVPAFVYILIATDRVGDDERRISFLSLIRKTQLGRDCDSRRWRFLCNKLPKIGVAGMTGSPFWGVFGDPTIVLRYASATSVASPGRAMLGVTAAPKPAMKSRRRICRPRA